MNQLIVLWIISMAFAIATTLVPVSINLTIGAGLLFIGFSISVAGLAVKEALDNIFSKMK